MRRRISEIQSEYHRTEADERAAYQQMLSARRSMVRARNNAYDDLLDARRVQSAELRFAEIQGAVEKRRRKINELRGRLERELVAERRIALAEIESEMRSAGKLKMGLLNRKRAQLMRELSALDPIAEADCLLNR